MSGEEMMGALSALPEPAAVIVKQTDKLEFLLVDGT
jgi:hypothetical protein